MNATPLVLFVCLHGSAKSQVAAAHCQRIAQARALPLRALSAGTEPDATIPERVMAGLQDDGFHIFDAAPRKLSPELLREARIIVSFGPDVLYAADVQSPQFIMRWDDVPAISDGYVAARDAIVQRVGSLLDEQREWIHDADGLDKQNLSP
ncbi:MAG: hypothetical protein ABIT38_01130 [Gemmatimonadaceae bacterium]